MTDALPEVLPIPHDWIRLFTLLAERRYPGAGMQAAHGWDWQQEARLVLEEYLSERHEDVQAWHEGAERRRIQAAARTQAEIAAREG